MKGRIIAFIIYILLFAVYEHADAVISSECSNCHTMHNSQGGEPVSDEGPYAQLLNAGCVACHTTALGPTSEFGAPAVLHTDPPQGQGRNKTLAGGDFYWVYSNEITNASLGHNVIDLPGVNSRDINMPDFTPPGWDPDATTGFRFGRVAEGAPNWNSQLNCAGTFGCHGLHSVVGNFPSIKGAHHNNSGWSATKADTADTLGNSYRFLGGIKGLEEEEWNWNETIETHNEYFGEDNVSGRNNGVNYGNRDTMSFLCAECHGFFHSAIDVDRISGSPWIRHPTDIILPDNGEYALYNTPDGSAIGNYSLEAPVARPEVPDESSSVVTPGVDIIMCLSCHRVHGSDQPDLLRWNYDEIIAGNTQSGGCFICHTEKNDQNTHP